MPKELRQYSKFPGDWRPAVQVIGKNGTFKTLDDLKRVPGVDPAKLDAPSTDYRLPGDIASSA
jgi:hypothetical protein